MSGWRRVSSIWLPLWSDDRECRSIRKMFEHFSVIASVTRGWTHRIDFGKICLLELYGMVMLIYCQRLLRSLKRLILTEWCKVRITCQDVYRILLLLHCRRTIYGWSGVEWSLSDLTVALLHFTYRRPCIIDNVHLLVDKVRVEYTRRKCPTFFP